MSVLVHVQCGVFNDHVHILNLKIIINLLLILFAILIYKLFHYKSIVKLVSRFNAEPEVRSPT